MPDDSVPDNTVPDDTAPDDTQAGRPGDLRSLRVSDAEREHVVELLQRATGSGLITLDEFTERVDTALAARTRGELNVVLLDLPGLTHPERPTGVPSRYRPPPTAAPPSGAVDTADGVELNTLLSSVTRNGRWNVPARLVVRTKAGSTELDFTEAHIPHDVVEIELDVVAGSVVLWVPAGATVEHHAVQTVMSGINDRRRSRAGAPPGPAFVLSGSVRAGSVELRPPRRLRWWRRG